MAGDDEDDMGDSTYAKFKTQNEIDQAEAFKSGPSYLNLDNLD